jgi:glycyl-tRNA synthetase beta chain
MPQLLLELFSEEIPARMQAGAARDLERMARERLSAAELAFDSLRVFAGPRRLTLVIDGLPPAQADRREERKGPRANAPDQALQGFLRSTGLTKDQLTERDGVYFACLDKPGRPTPVIVAEMAEAIIRSFPWPKSMRWGGGTLRWVRPLKRILCLFDGAVVPFIVDGIESGDVTEGHRFMGERHEPFSVLNFDDYAMGLAKRFVILDAAERKREIEARAKAVCAQHGLELVEDQGLLEEVAGLAEWPVPILGDMDPSFLDLPPEVIRTSMRVHQRYFAVRDPATGKLAPHFLVTANIAPEDGGAVIAHGNARVLTARLSDARFFWTEDQRPGAIDAWLDKLNGVTFHAKLGTMAERVERIAALAEEIAPLVGADPKLARIAAKLCKADLASGMVAEFPELQGVMGGYYVRALAPAVFEGEGTLTADEVNAVADAVRDHYKPLGPSDSVPTAPVTVAVALADKLDTLVGFFAIDEKPTGSRDPFGLRRAALGVIRLVLETHARIGTEQLIDMHCVKFFLGSVGVREFAPNEDQSVIDSAAREMGEKLKPHEALIGGLRNNGLFELRSIAIAAPHIITFLADRLKVLLRDEGKRHDLVDAVFALGDDDLVRIVRRVEALDGFLKTEDGASLLAGYKRASNILKIEEKKDGVSYSGTAEHLAEAPAAETALIDAIAQTLPKLDEALAAEDYTEAMIALSKLRIPLDTFFGTVFVNDPAPDVRKNRLILLSQIRAAADRVADFSKISG